MTTPRVTVPVEPTEAMLDNAAGTLVVQGLNVRQIARQFWSAMLSAAPAPEGGAVKGPGDYTMVLTEPQAFERFHALASHIERMAVGRSVGSLIEWNGFLRELNVVLATRSDGKPEGGAVSEAAWDVVRRVSKLTVAGGDPLQDPAFAQYPAIANLVAKAQAALATREEAPAEAVEIVQAENPGGYLIKDSADGWFWTPHRIAAVAALTDGHAVYDLRAQPQAREEEGGTLDPAFVAWLRERDCLPNDDDGTIEWADIVCALNDWEADLTQAREDAQPVAWRWKTPIQHVGDGTRWGWTFASHPSTPPASINPEPLYTHPAPDALRAAVEALGKARESIQGWYEAQSGEDFTEAGHAVFLEDIASIDQALAALQAEQKGGA